MPSRSHNSERDKRSTQRRAWLILRWWTFFHAGESRSSERWERAMKEAISSRILMRRWCASFKERNKRSRAWREQWRETFDYIQREIFISTEHTISYLRRWRWDDDVSHIIYDSSRISASNSTRDNVRDDDKSFFRREKYVASDICISLLIRQ